jgi:hypothetical protein
MLLLVSLLKSSIKEVAAPAIHVPDTVKSEAMQATFRKREVWLRIVIKLDRYFIEVLQV